MIPVIAIFDIGKTNKKFFLFNEDYKIVEELSVYFEEIEDEDGFACEDIRALRRWVLDTLSQYIHSNTYDIKAVNFSAYGASFVHLDAHDNLVAPLYNYLKPYPVAVEEKFYSAYGTKEDIALRTASPALGNLNSGLQLYSLKYHKPRLFERTAQSVHFPQYLSSLISGQKYSDITSIGCHTALWDFSKSNYHDWVMKEDIDKKLPPIFSSAKSLDINYNGKQLKCGIGLHDSSAAFIPYIQNIAEPFLLISTGTWCISMNAFNDSPLTRDELEKDCLCYMTYEGGTVKSSRLFAGYAHEQIIKKLSQHFIEVPNYFEKIAYDKTLLKEEPELRELTDFDVTNYHSYEEAYTNFIKQVIIAQKRSTDLVYNNVKIIFVDGGFAKNETYMQLLAEAYPKAEVYAASVSQATAIGAAMAIHKDWNHLELPDNIISTRRY
ncbi:FGGY-family carbohydrate kinase [Niabella ginsengisoli]|uniref:Carbohydrate kinase n=1 Tax=Niabella ginsengisoli TaxID=522298 RepID=A0ABS9SQX7_9BACT|nr:FGGY family carbohydrate kinase [Niabella ginsengisoli]MCH5600780.1 carbohydrate kinase [Niabella ginsengisoli]